VEVLLQMIGFSLRDKFAVIPGELLRVCSIGFRNGGEAMFCRSAHKQGQDYKMCGRDVELA
jgi:hypothetical protein